jgi:energy-coupling factor transport system ATP-binding protein
VSSPAPLVDLRRVSFVYPGAERPALADLSFRMAAGEMVVVMGRSGAGKTTLARCLNRAIPSYQPGALSGEVWIDGAERSAADVAALAGIVGLVTQDFEAQLFSTNVALEVAFGMEQLGVDRRQMRERVAQALARVGLAGFERRDPSTLSGGEKQRLSIAAVLAMRPKLIVFDEPTTDLDPLGKREIFAVLRSLRAQGVGVVLIEHEIEACRGADRLVLMSGGRIAEDAPPDDLLRRVDRLGELGVAAGDLDRLAAALGRRGRFAGVAEAAAELAARGPLRGPAAEPPGAGEPLVALRDVDFAYPEGPPVLRGISTQLRAGELVALIGANGSGKTTLSKHLNGLLRPGGGTVELRGRDLTTLSLEEAASDVGYVFQNPDHQIFADTVLAEVRFAAENLDLPETEIAERARSAIAAVGLEGGEEEDPFGLGKGHRQRLAVASLLVLRPRLLILDEPTTGLDVVEQREMMQLLGRLRDGGTCVLVITHAPWVVAEWAQRCLVLERGALIFDGPARQFLVDTELARRSDFEPPDATRVGLELGLAVRSFGELSAAAGLAPPPPGREGGSKSPRRQL